MGTTTMVGFNAALECKVESHTDDAELVLGLAMNGVEACVIKSGVAWFGFAPARKSSWHVRRCPSHAAIKSGVKPVRHRQHHSQ